MTKNRKYKQSNKSIYPSENFEEESENDPFRRCGQSCELKRLAKSLLPDSDDDRKHKRLSLSEASDTNLTSNSSAVSLSDPRLGQKKKYKDTNRSRPQIRRRNDKKTWKLQIRKKSDAENLEETEFTTTDDDESNYWNIMLDDSKKEVELIKQPKKKRKPFPDTENLFPTEDGTGKQSLKENGTEKQPQNEAGTEKQSPKQVGTNKQPPKEVGKGKQPPKEVSTVEQPPKEVNTGQQPGTITPTIEPTEQSSIECIDLILKFVALTLAIFAFGFYISQYLTCGYYYYN